jgi:hypothetical protein
MYFPARCKSVELTPASKSRGYTSLFIRLGYEQMRHLAEKVLQEFQRKTGIGDLELSFFPFEPGYITHPPFMQTASFKVSSRGKRKLLFEMPNGANRQEWGDWFHVMMPKDLPLDTVQFLDEFAKTQLRPEEPYKIKESA